MKKSVDKNSQQNSNPNTSGKKISTAGAVSAESEEEKAEKEELEEAKKLSRNKAADRDQTEMIKKLIIESIVKYSVLISLLVVTSIAIIKFGPALATSLNGALSKVLMSAIGQ